MHHLSTEQKSRPGHGERFLGLGAAIWDLRPQISSPVSSQDKRAALSDIANSLGVLHRTCHDD